MLNNLSSPMPVGEPFRHRLLVLILFLCVCKNSKNIRIGNGKCHYLSFSRWHLSVSNIDASGCIGHKSSQIYHKSFLGFVVLIQLSWKTKTLKTLSSISIFAKIRVCYWWCLIVNELPSFITSTTSRIPCFGINESKNIALLKNISTDEGYV